MLAYGKNGPRLSEAEINQLTGSARDLQVKFTSFIKRHIKYSPRLYNRTDVEQYLQTNDFDIVMCGSDQIWNPFMTTGFDTTYMLDFGAPCRKISYATSMMDIQYISEFDKYPKVQALLEDFYAVSVRENTARTIIQHLTGGKVEPAVVVDPTLLLTRQEWEQTLNIPSLRKRRYIFCYMFHISDSQKALLKRMAAKYNCDTVVFADILKSDGSLVEGMHTELAKTVSIEQFLALIRHSAAVLTDSFHGTVFSIQFEKEFFAVESAPEKVKCLDKGHPRNVDRFETLLGKTELAHRFLHFGEENTAELYEQIMYDEVKNKVEKEREYSLAWLKKAIG